METVEIMPRLGPWWRIRQSIIGTWIRSELCADFAGFVLKTDLFDEASGPHHHAGGLPDGMRFLGMDIDLSVVRLARERLREQDESPDLVVCDVRNLPFAEGRVAAILSLSTLDHFREEGEIQAALLELARVLLPESRLLLTLDNPANPEVALRQILPAWLVTKLRADNFPLGVTAGPLKMERFAEECGLQLMRSQYLLHSLRYPLVRVSSWLASLRRRNWNRVLENLILFSERLAALPTRSLTGHYIAWTMNKPSVPLRRHPRLREG